MKAKETTENKIELGYKDGDGHLKPHFHRIQNEVYNETVFEIMEKFNDEFKNKVFEVTSARFGSDTQKILANNNNFEKI